jgi:hypothetical protein
MGDEDVRVRRIDHRGLRGLVEQIRGVGDQVLVERFVLSHQHRERSVRTPARASRLLPHRRTGSRIAHQQRRVQRPDVDAELERVRRGDGDQLVVREPSFELASILG